MSLDEFQLYDGQDAQSTVGPPPNTSGVNRLRQEVLQRCFDKGPGGHLLLRRNKS